MGRRSCTWRSVRSNDHRSLVTTNATTSAAERLTPAKQWTNAPAPACGRHSPAAPRPRKSAASERCCPAGRSQADRSPRSREIRGRELRTNCRRDAASLPAQDSERHRSRADSRSRAWPRARLRAKGVGESVPARGSVCKLRSNTRRGNRSFASTALPHPERARKTRGRRPSLRRRRAGQARERQFRIRDRILAPDQSSFSTRAPSTAPSASAGAARPRRRRAAPPPAPAPSTPAGVLSLDLRWCA